MSLISIPYIFAPGTTIASAQVNADFSAIVGVVNGNLDASNFSTVFSSLNLASKGHATFPGGLILQWGDPTVAYDNSAALSVTFDIQFTTKLLSLVATVNQNNAPTAALVVPYASWTASSLSSFSLAAAGGQSGTSGNVSWIALGY